MCAMIPTDRFIYQATELHTLLQPDCPVFVYSSRRCTDRASGAAMAQVRMVNRSEQTIRTVFLQIEGLNAGGQAVYTLRELTLTQCNAAPHSIFGEQRLLMLERQPVASLRITVQRVVFADGMVWKRLPEHLVCELEESDWQRCSCAMVNPPEQTHCSLCGAPLTVSEEKPVIDALQAAVETPEEYIPLELPQEKPAPIVRYIPLPEEEEDEEETTNWAAVILCIFGALAVLAALAFLFFCLMRYPL